jgi:polysaccharide deacetylase family protein (PEP-CTERM system associated)
MNNPMIVNALTIDVEDYFQINAFSHLIRPQDWDSFEPLVEKNTYQILDLLDSNGSPELLVMSDRTGCLDTPPRATFFVLGWVAERYPALVREVLARGHEVACHGYSHQRILSQTEDDFREDVKRAKEILEDLLAVEVIGYRAPTFSIRSDTLWALEILFELGFRYDSSIFPIKHDVYGFPKAPRFPFYLDFTNGDILSQFKNPKYLHEVDKSNQFDSNERAEETSAPPFHTLGSIPDSHFVEFPLSTVRLFGCNLPFCGGGYFRLFPYWYARWGLNRINKSFEKSGIFYIHPWELDPKTPRINNASPLSKFRTYVNLKQAPMRFKRLLTEFRFAPLASLVK